MKIYLAGKISKNDWRHNLVPSLRHRLTVGDLDDRVRWADNHRIGDCAAILANILKWSYLPHAIFDVHDYVGPFFVSCDHGCFHRDNAHGFRFGGNSPGGIFERDFVSGDDEVLASISHTGIASTTRLVSTESAAGCAAYCYGAQQYKPHNCDCDSETKNLVMLRCLEAIRACDIVFAWLDDPSAYGTIAEIGYARALNKLLFVASPRFLSDLWLTYEIADNSKDRCHKDNGPICSHVNHHATDPESAFKQFLEQHGWDSLSSLCESPIELQFWKQARLEIPGLTPQVPCGPYRLDFALAALRLGIEIDGHDGHKSKDQRTHDAQRDRFLDRQGWTVLRFTGSEVFANVRKCIRELNEAMAVRTAVMLKDGPTHVIH